jgi:hypothetical protein
MEKILTIFDRDWEGNRGVINKFITGIDSEFLKRGLPTEKINGTNVRVTVRNHMPVRLEKRRNPTKIQKAKGIVDPWYVDADEFSPQDKYLFEAMANTDFFEVPDGELPAEAYGPKIQGNPLMVDSHHLFIFSLLKWREKIKFDHAPVDFDGLKEWLPKQRSLINPNAPIEGIVWHFYNGVMFKIKTKDFK